MKFVDSIKENNWLSVKMMLLELYPDEEEDISDYEEVFSKLRTLQPEESNFSIVVNWKKDDFEHTYYADVSGYCNDPKKQAGNTTTTFALEFTSWNEWLGMTIDKTTLQTFNELEIIAHCLYEMTFVSFDEEEIKDEMNRLKDAVEEIKNMTEEEKHDKLKSWNDVLKEEGNR